MKKLAENYHTRRAKAAGKRRAALVKAAWPEVVHCLESALTWAKKKDSGWSRIEAESALRLLETIRVTE